MGAQAVRLSNVDINNALENKDFEVLFQPIFDLGNGALARMETFVRWRHPSLGVLPPGAFISFFESQGRMSELTRYIFSAALESYAAWRGPCAPGFSVNLSLADLADDTFSAHLKTLLETHEFPADLITLECPMPPVDSDLEGMIDKFTQLRETGARLAIEVRGRASEFLRTVDPFPFDEIKTGGSSILRFARTVRGPGLSAISDLLDIANKANAVTTAVGVEDQASLSALRGLGFTAAQGNHLGKVGVLNDFRPARVNEVRELLELPALKGDDLTALFRTTAPEPHAATPDTETQAGRSETEAEEITPAEDAVEATKTEAEKQAFVERARKKAKAIALAKRAKARDARKVAAIKRAKAKVAIAKQQDDADPVIDVDAEDPRELQDRIAQEFGGAPDDQIDAAEPIDDDVDASTIETTPEGNASPMTDDQSDDDSAPADGDASKPSNAAAREPQDQNAISIKMPIGAAPVYFHPGISTSGTIRSFGSEPPATETPVQSDERLTPPDISFADGSDEPVQPAHEQTLDTEHHLADETVARSTNEPTADISANAVPEKQDANGRKRRKPKSFLSRKYNVMPTHFWPKPWRQALQRRNSDHENAANA